MAGTGAGFKERLYMIVSTTGDQLTPQLPVSVTNLSGAQAAASPNHV